MNCPGCRARNPIGNKFCRECGQKLPLEENTLAQEEAQRAELERARERAAQLLTKAFALSQHNKPAEALPLAEEAAELLPSSTSALTLCSTLYERMGQSDKAISMMERVVALNPHSAVDADKLDRLRRGVHLQPKRPTLTEEVPEESPRTWLPIAAAVGVGALVLILGITSLVRLLGKKPVPRLSQRTEVGVQSPAGFFPNVQATKPLTGSTVGPLSPAIAAPPQDYRDPFKPLGNTPLAQPPAPENPMRALGPRAGRPTGNVILPNPREVPTGSGFAGSVPPLTLSNGGQDPADPRRLPPLGGVQRNPETIPAGPPPVGQGGGIPASNPGSGNPGSGQGQGSESSEGSGYIRVREHSSGAGERRETQGASRGGDPLLRAQALQASGKYREALTAFREALATGAAAGEVRQGIALCHQRLGEKIPARAAYQQAISAFEAQVRAGRSVDQASRGIAACRAGLDVLGN